MFWMNQHCQTRLFDKFTQKKNLLTFKLLCTLSCLNIPQEDLLSSVDRSVKLDKCLQKMAYPVFPPHLLPASARIYSQDNPSLWHIMQKQILNSLWENVFPGTRNEYKMLLKHLVKVKKGEDFRWDAFKLDIWVIHLSLHVVLYFDNIQFLF